MTIKDTLKGFASFFCAFIYIICAVDVVGYAIYNKVTACAICGAVLAAMAFPFFKKCVKQILYGNL